MWRAKKYQVLGLSMVVGALAGTANGLIMKTVTVKAAEHLKYRRVWPRVGVRGAVVLL